MIDIMCDAMGRTNWNFEPNENGDKFIKKWTEVFKQRFSQQPPKERKVSLEEFAKKLAHKDIPSKTWDDWSYNQQNWYIKEASEILSLLNATEERKGA